MPAAETVTDIADLAQRLRARFATGLTRPIEWRQRQLARLCALVREHEAEFAEALRADLGKSALDAYAQEISIIVGEAEHARKGVAAWARPEKVSTPLVNQPGSSFIMRDPLGVVLVIGPWNYPLQLVLSPLAGAIAAGNCAVLKPSELAPKTSAQVARWLPEYLDTSCYRVVEGGAPETTALLDQAWDHIFYTGGATVGRIVMTAAARNLTPVTLELGGKSPCIVDREADLKVAARRIVWGKFLNAGQTCVAPDYVLARSEIKDELLAEMVGNVERFYGPDPRTSPDYGRIVNGRHHARLMGLLDGERIVTGGQADPLERYIAPTILCDVAPDSKVMREEIFGPILPVLGVEGLDEAIAFINARPKPLALYVFSADKHAATAVLERTSSGGACVNDCLTHLVGQNLPFGGVGPSGMGAYHGRHSFETFSHRKAVLKRSTALDAPIRYPPYDESKAKWFRRLL